MRVRLNTSQIRAALASYISSGASVDSAQSANTVKAGPESGPVATPTYRALVAADLPNVIKPTGSAPAVEFYDANGVNAGNVSHGNGSIAGVRGLWLRTPDVTLLTDNWHVMRFGSSVNKWFFGDNGVNAYLQTGRELKIKTAIGSSSATTATDPDVVISPTRGVELFDSSLGSAFTDKTLAHRLYNDRRYHSLYYAKTGTYLTNSLTAGDAVNIAAVANSLRTCPLVITKPITFTQIDSCVNGAVGGTTYRLALYTDLNGYPDAIVAGSDNAAYDSSSTGTKASGPVSITLTPGLYHIAYNSNGGPLLAGWSNVSQPQVLGISSITSGSTPNVSWMVNTVYGAMPATFPVGATLLAANAVKIGLLI